MTDLAIGVIGATSITVLIAVLTLAIKGMDARKDAGAAQVDAEHLRGELAIANADTKTWQTEATVEKARADALYKELADADATASPADARAAVLQRWKQAHAARAPAAGDPSTVPVAEPPKAGAAGS